MSSVVVCPKCKARVRVDGISLEDFELCGRCTSACDSSRCLECTYDDDGEVDVRCDECESAHAEAAHERSLSDYYGGGSGEHAYRANMIAAGRGRLLP